MPPPGEASFYRAHGVADALSALHERGERGEAIAGGTWVMRAPLRGIPQDRAYVSIADIEELRQVSLSETEVVIGAGVSHSQLAHALASNPPCHGLAYAAGHSANPAIRNVATVGGNLCAAGFAAADLLPALMSLGAQVDLEGRAGADRISLERFVEIRDTLQPGHLICKIIVPLDRRSAQRSAHVRLPLRRAGDYPVAIVSVAVSLSPGGVVEHACVVVGSVEPIPRRWPAMEAALTGRLLDSKLAIASAEAAADEFVGRDGVEAPGWYRVKVLPTLMGRVIEQLTRQ